MTYRQVAEKSFVRWGSNALNQGIGKICSYLVPHGLHVNRVCCCILLGLSVSCAGAAPSSDQEPRLRRQTPVSACTELIPPGPDPGVGVVRAYDPEQWMAVLAPNMGEDEMLASTERDCTGHYLFASDSLRGGVQPKGWPLKFDADDLLSFAGPAGMRGLWYPVLTFQNGDRGGPLALVRAIDDRAEVYGIGAFRGSKTTDFSSARLGDETILVGEESRCETADDCRRIGHFYLLRRGRLLQAASADLERQVTVPSVTARGLYAEYTLRTDVTYKAEGVLLLEQVKVRLIKTESPNRDSDRDLRKVEFARLLRVDRDTLYSSNEPLWERVVGQD